MSYFLECISRVAQQAKKQEKQIKTKNTATTGDMKSLTIDIIIRQGKNERNADSACYPHNLALRSSYINRYDQQCLLPLK